MAVKTIRVDGLGTGRVHQQSARHSMPRKQLPLDMSVETVLGSGSAGHRSRRLR